MSLSPLTGSFLITFPLRLLTLHTVSEASTQNFLALGNFSSLHFTAVLLF